MLPVRGQRPGAEGHGVGVGEPGGDGLDQDNGVTAYTYDSFGDITSRTDANTHTTAYTYDAAHRLTQTTDPLGRTVAYDYDVDGNPTTTTNARGQTITTAYDGRGLPTGTTYSDDTTATDYTYDTAGEVTGITDATGNRTATYDDAGRLLTLSAPGSSTPFTYTYDADGDVTARTYPDGTKATFTYNSDDETTAQTANSATVKYAYDAAGNLTTTTLPSANGYTESRTYDAAGQLASVASANSAATLSSWTATRDANGRPSTVSSVRASATAPPTSYSYDDNGRLLSECTAPSGSTGCPSGSSKTTYTYDQVGNRLTKTTSGSGSSSTAYTYDAADELTSSTTGSTTTSNTYDDDGNQTSAGPNTFAYNAAGQLATATLGSNTYAYTYDATGNRTTTHTNGTLSRTTQWDINNPLPQIADETNGSGTLIGNYRYDPLGEPQALHTSAGTYYDHHDLSGSVTDLTSSSGVDQYTYAYDAYGTTTTTALTTSAPANPFAYTGQYQDPAGSALGYQLRARTYDPTTGRFTSTDPAPSSAAQPATSPYAYADDDPTTLTDPSGACPECVSAAIGGIVGGVFGGVSYTLSHPHDFSWSGLGEAAGKSALYGVGAGLLMPAAGTSAVELLGLEEGSTAATVTSATVNAGVGAAYTWAFDTALCEPTTPGDLLFGALGGGLSGLFSGGSPTSLSAVEEGASQPRLFPNQWDDADILARELANAEAAGVTPMEAGTRAFDEAVTNGGKYLWAVGADGKLRILYEASKKIKHSVLFRGEPVQGAGDVIFENGKVSMIGNQSGHYYPLLDLDVPDSFLLSGVTAFRNAGVEVPEEAIEPYAQ
ncbi:YD repeat (two copies) [Streptomyces sp. HGB0020]|nr:YD repeat (two copies) [Streptomyces sp. HGB0020]